MSSNNENDERPPSWLFRRTPRYYGYVFGFFVAVVFLAGVLIPPHNQFIAPGQMNIGHEKLKCSDCHRDGLGTARQQLQAKLQFWLKKRQSDVSFGYKAVSNETCLDCHSRPYDRHPSHRFFEPKFEQARRETNAQMCTACHADHKGVRIALTDTGFCRSCHKDTVVKKDPLDTPHKELFAANKWGTCLGCHDFHGNHDMEISKRMNDTIKESLIRKWFAGKIGPIYTLEKRTPSSTELKNE